MSQPTDMPLVNRTYDRWLPLLACVLTWIVFLPFAPIGMDPHHDGIMLKPALDVLAGKTLFRDSFNQYGPVTTYVHAGALAVFGKSLLSLRLATVFCYGVAAGIFVAVWRTFLPASLVALAIFLWLLLAPFYSVYWMMLPWSSVVALVFQALALWLALGALGLRDTRLAPWTLAALSGASTAFATGCRLPVGVLLGASLVVAALGVGYGRDWRAARRFLLAFTLGGLATVAAFLLSLALTGALADWHAQTIVWPARWAAHATPRTPAAVLRQLLPMNSEFLRVSSIPGTIPAVILLFVLLYVPSVRMKTPLLLVAALVLGGAAFLLDGALMMSVFALATLVPLVVLAHAFRLLKAPPTTVEQAAAWTATLVALSAWPQYYPVECPRHIYWGMAPALGSFLYALYQTYDRKLIPVFAVVVSIILPLTYMKIEEASVNLSSPRVTVRDGGPLHGMRLTPSLTERMHQLHHQIEPFNDRPVLVESFNAIWSAFSENPDGYGPYFVRWPKLPYPADEEEQRDRFIRERKPLIFVGPEYEPTIEVFQRKYGYVPLVHDVVDGVTLLKPPT